MNVFPPAVRNFARWSFIRWLWATGSLGRARRALVEGNAILVLTLHRVLTDVERSRAHSEPGIVVSRENFEALMEYLAGHYQVMRLAELASGAWPPPSGKPRVAVTFDDGWQDNFEPVLAEARRRATPLTIFVCSDLTGMQSPFWPEHVRALLSGTSEAERQQTIAKLKTLAKAERTTAIQRLAERSDAGPADRNRLVATVDATMSWDALQQLQRAGVDIESHAKSHEILTTLTETEAGYELSESRKVLREKLGRDGRVLAYPNGNHSSTIRRLAREAGYGLGCAVAEGFWTAGQDRLAIPRVNICDSRLAGADGKFSALRFEYAVVWRAWQAHLRRARKFEQTAGVPAASAEVAAQEANE